MKKFMLGIIVSASSLATMAGWNGGSQVVISGDLAYGSFRDVRYSADATQYISCYTQHPSGGVSFGSCQARNAANVYKSCFTTDPAMLDIIQSLSGTTDYAWFRTAADGSCSRISSVTSSFNL